jgi:hypothetical protein
MALALSSGALASGLMWAAPAQADPTDDAFLSALTNAGVAISLFCPAAMSSISNGQSPIPLGILGF